jgi:DNA/RNA endonuclease G (NUC1)
MRQLQQLVSLHSQFRHPIRMTETGMVVQLDSKSKKNNKKKTLTFFEDINIDKIGV